MPKKFATENPKVTAARDRKETAKKTEQDKKQKAVEDAYWKDDDKLVNRKLQRKDEDERKRLEAVKRKEENRKMAEEELNSLAGKTTSTQSKVTRSDIEKRREAQILAKLQEEKQKQLEAQKIQVVEHVEENTNLQEAEVVSARNIDEALDVLGAPADDMDKHPEKRMRAAYLAYEELRLPELKKEHPTFRLSQLKQILKKEWQKSPENPLNARLLAMAK